MLVIMKKDYTKEQAEAVVKAIEGMGYVAHPILGDRRSVIGVTGNEGIVGEDKLKQMLGVSSVVRISQPNKLSGREFHPEDTRFMVGGSVEIGPDTFTVIAGPCTVESEEQTLRIARAVKAAGADMLRGGAWKPRSSPYSFQGMHEDGLKILAAARAETGLPVVTEALDPKSLELVANYADMIQIGTRNMQNFELLKLAGQTNIPVMLKRGFSATMEEWLLAAEYIMDGGNRNVILCERGVRSFDKNTRNLLDVMAVPVIQKMSHLPILIDPSHATGHNYLIEPAAKAAFAVGANAMMVDVHDRPEEALCDGPQSLHPTQFAALVRDLNAMAPALGKKLVGANAVAAAAAA